MMIKKLGSIGSILRKRLEKLYAIWKPSDIDVIYKYYNDKGAEQVVTRQVKPNTGFTPIDVVDDMEDFELWSMASKLNGEISQYGSSQTGAMMETFSAGEEHLSPTAALVLYAQTTSDVEAYVEYCENPHPNIKPSKIKQGVLASTEEKAAENFARMYQPDSINEDREYGTFIYKKNVKVKGTRKKKAYYSYVYPKAGKQNSVTIPWNWFWLKKKVAVAHTHSRYDDEMEKKQPGVSDDFSPKDISNADRLKKPSYLATPSGELKKYDPSKPYGKRYTTLLKDLAYDPNHPKRKAR